MVKISKIAAFVTLSVFFAVYLTAAPLVTLRDVYFYLSKVPIGAEESHFKRGDTVYVVARPP
ncbi:MAG: hypothetical protein QXY83_03700, partial [Thermosphaera sp.]